jgi:hypothetical protein
MRDNLNVVMTSASILRVTAGLHPGIREGKCGDVLVVDARTCSPIASETRMGCHSGRA